MTQTDRSISTPSARKSGAAWLASETAADLGDFAISLPDATVKALPYLFEFWALDHQLPPEGDWRTWVIMGGRGAGKTRAGSEWIRSMVEGARPDEPGRAKRVALIGETIEQTREVMVFGESGILACSPPDRRPEWIATRKRLVWPNGAVAQLFSAHEPESLRGPQFDLAWADELAKWKKGAEVWDMLQFGLRLGDLPRACVTTTPRNVAVLKALIAQPSTVMTHAPTAANRANLADSFMTEMERRYAGTRQGRQELDGILLSDPEGVLWTTTMLDACRVEELPEFHRVVVAVDPPVTGHSGSDECGIVVVGVVMDGPPHQWRAYVIEDATVTSATPLEWAKAAVKACERHGADRLVAETNQGGDMVETIVRQVGPLVSYKGVHASRGKLARAEPVAALYEQGLVHHVKGLDALEDQMGQMTRAGYVGGGSPDRVDALVWALQEAVLDTQATWREPRIRSIF